jgi:hypothetical protein
MIRFCAEMFLGLSLPSRALFVRLAVSLCGSTPPPDGGRRHTFQPIFDQLAPHWRRDPQSIRRELTYEHYN